ncbi:TetR/AcrR family transcriptional regulator [Dethiobacter alkaliphilus]|uniref:Transcriptional regulator, TetR family n=1 Tax=Dethiobacter alkaliphilus AHT 1 TaxID=555088 RepID=C0GJT1_DETAL|nr:TetR/AcrR family transcriptional regulator [Dethiobacter alkaliphilus]EEG76389.1 transcriptional regulator, TetR family [Dethiobacter alkaliphilus AHT 1]
MDKKQLIIKHAADIIAEKGYHGATPKVIAGRAGIAVGTIYLYFKSKEEILDYIFVEEFKKREKFLLGLNTKEYSFYEKLELFLDFHFDELESDESTGTVLIQESTNPQQQSLEGVQKFLTELPEIFADMLQQAQKNNEIRALDSQFAARIIFHSIRGAVMELKKEAVQKGHEDIKHELKTFFWNAIKKTEGVLPNENHQDE